MSSARSVRAHRAHGIRACKSSARSVGVRKERTKCARTSNAQSVLARQAAKECEGHHEHKTCACVSSGRSARINMKRTKYVHEYQARAVHVAHQARRMCARSVHLYIRYMTYMCANFARAKFVWRIGRTDFARAHQAHSSSRTHVAHTVGMRAPQAHITHSRILGRVESACTSSTYSTRMLYT